MSAPEGSFRKTCKLPMGLPINKNGRQLKWGLHRGVNLPAGQLVSAIFPFSSFLSMICIPFAPIYSFPENSGNFYNLFPRCLVRIGKISAHDRAVNPLHDLGRLVRKMRSERLHHLHCELASLLRKILPVGVIHLAEFQSGNSQSFLDL